MSEENKRVVRRYFEELDRRIMHRKHKSLDRY